MASPVKMIPMTVASLKRNNPSSDHLMIKQLPPSSTKILDNPKLQSFISGSFSTGCFTVLFQPLDLIKTRIQRTKNTTNTPQVSSKVSMMSVVRQVFRNESILGFWKGLSPSLYRSVPGSGIYFATISCLKTHLPYNDKSPAQTLALGFFARSFAATILIPMTVIKVRSESGNFNNSSVYGTLRNIYRTEGLSGLRSGLSPTILRDALFSGIFLTLRTWLRGDGAKYFGQEKEFNSTVGLLATEILAGIAAGVLSQPFDTMKTRIQLKSDRNMASAVQSILKEGQLRGLFAGLFPRLLRRSLAATFTWTLHDWVMDLFTTINQK